MAKRPCLDAVAKDAGRLSRSSILVHPAGASPQHSGIRQIPLKQDKPFKAIRAHGRWVSGRILSVCGIPENQADIRIGIRVPKSYGTAVRRNQIKRRIKTLFREMTPASAPPAGDYLVVIRGPSRPTIGSLREELFRLISTFQPEDDS